MQPCVNTRQTETITITRLLSKLEIGPHKQHSTLRIVVFQGKNFHFKHKTKEEFIFSITEMLQTPIKALSPEKISKLKCQIKSKASLILNQNLIWALRLWGSSKLIFHPNLQKREESLQSLRDNWPHTNYAWNSTWDKRTSMTFAGKSQRVNWGRTQMVT